MLRVTVLCTDPGHPVNEPILDWARRESPRARVEVRRDYRELKGGDFLFLVSCHQIIGKAVRDRYRHTLVLHASALPRGRGMSPHVWQILEGSKQLPVTLLNAEDALDSGAIWHQVFVDVPPTALFGEINRRLFDAEVGLMTWALDHCDHTHPTQQHGEPTFYRKRTPADSQIDVHRPLAEFFDLLRVADPERYPAFFEHRGERYRIRIDKLARPE
jgi:methionyl-tRNA formyltransferase